jgi:hypothetical protein
MVRGGQLKVCVYVRRGKISRVFGFPFKFV